MSMNKQWLRQCALGAVVFSLFFPPSAKAAEDLMVVSPVAFASTTQFSESLMSLSGISEQLGMPFGGETSAIETVVDLMLQSAGRYRDNKMVLYVTGIGKFNGAMMFVEEAPGRVRVFNPHLRFPATDKSLALACNQLMEAHGIVGKPPRQPRNGTYFTSGAKPYEGEITVTIENGSFSMNIVYPPDLPIEKHLNFKPPEETPEQYEQRKARDIIARAERFFGPAQVVETEDGTIQSVPPKRIDVRTQLPVPWPEGEEPPQTR